MTPEYLLYPIIANAMNQVINYRTGYILLDVIIMGFIFIMVFGVDRHTIKTQVKNIYSKYFSQHFTNNMVVLCNEDNKQRTYRYRAIMYYMSLNKHNTVHRVKEVSEVFWDNDDNKTEVSEFIVDQEKEFILDEHIYGYVATERKERNRSLDRTETIDMNILTIYSKKYDINYLQKWIDMRVSEFKQYLKIKSSEEQLLVTVSHDSKRISVEGSPWSSTVTFDNSYFHMKDQLLSKIDFFLNNQQWYIDHGIPYNLGILLYGEPGCGKTRFIKQLMNYTKRHGIDIKLCDNFDFNELKEVIYNEEIDYKFIIPQDQRIIIFEDIDAMGNVIKERKNTPDSEDEDDSSLEKKEQKIIQKLMNIETKNNNNNLSFLLNILDGLNECSGRIIIMTTNKIDILDKALIRPGRIDIKIEFTKCSTYDIMMMIRTFWKIDIDINMIRTDINMKYTSAEVINIFRTTFDFEDIKSEFLI